VRSSADAGAATTAAASESNSTMRPIFVGN
jgi:hypothetical protein